MCKIHIYKYFKHLPIVMHTHMHVDIRTFIWNIFILNLEYKLYTLCKKHAHVYVYNKYFMILQL